MKLVKAKLKTNFEDILRVQCCPEYLQGIKTDPDYQGILTLDLDKSANDFIYCAYCGKDFGLVHGVTEVRSGLLTPLDLFDLDEGEYGTN